MTRSAVVVAVLSFASTAFAQECVPACRSGYCCHEGQCISQCNPPCPAGSTCLPNGECAAATAQTAPSAAGPGLRVNQGWGTAAGVVGAVSAGVILALTGVTIAINGTDAATYVGAVASLFAGVSIPIVAVGAASSRWDPQIRGASGWRITGWIAYVLCMVDALVAVGIGVAGYTFPSYGIASIGALGVIAAVSHMIDAFSSASQAEALATTGRVGARWRHSPVLALAPDGRGGTVGYVGWRLTF